MADPGDNGATRPLALSALILAGGESRRMGRDKAWLELEGRPLVLVTLEKLRIAGIEEVFLSGRRGVDYSSLGCPVLLDLEPGQGPLGGIERGLQRCMSPMLLVLAVDLPRMTVDFLRWLMASAHGPEALDRGGAGSGVGVVPVINGHLEPLVACYPKAAHGTVVTLLGEKELAARAFAARCIQDGMIRALEVPVELEPCLTNWNTPGLGA